MAPLCPGCKGSNISKVGPIPPAGHFCGMPLKEALFSDLYECGNCFLSFRWPRISYDRCCDFYRGGEDCNPAYTKANRRDWKVALDWLKYARLKESILDIGCYDGEFLSQVNFQKKHGIEINKEAIKAAAVRGTTVIETDISRLNEISGPGFDAVVALDIMEHVEDPEKFLSDIFALVKDGGIIIISTVNTLSPSWRLMKNKYWYCFLAEHITFINKKWLSRAVRKNGNFVIDEIQNIAHTEDGTNPLADILKNLTYKASPSFFGLLRKMGFGGINISEHPGLVCAPPYWHSARDHFIVKIIKSDGNRY